MNFKALEAYLKTLKEVEIPGFDVSVMQDHREVFRFRDGYSDKEKTKPVAEEDIYRLYSASKLLTCTAGVQLLMAGKIGLDDRLDKYFPEYAHMKVRNKNGELTDAQNPILIRHLFTMSAGLSYDLKAPCLLEARVQHPEYGTREFVRAMAGDPLNFEPGTHFLYSLCHDVLGAVIEEVSGMSFGEYLQKNIFDPLDMKEMTFHLPPEKESRMAAMYNYNTPMNEARYIEPTPNIYVFSDTYESGGAGLIGGVSDYARFVDALACGGVGMTGNRILSEEGVRMMKENLLCRDALRDFRSSPRKYGYGWGLCGRVHMNPVASQAKSPVGEFGWDGAAGAYALIDPDHRLSAFFGMHVFGCSYAYERIHPTIRDLVEQAIAE